MLLTGQPDKYGGRGMEASEGTLRNIAMNNPHLLLLLLFFVIGFALENVFLKCSYLIPYQCQICSCVFIRRILIAPYVSVDNIILDPKTWEQAEADER